MLRGKSTSAQAGQLHDLMAEMMLQAKLDDKEIFKQLVLESRASMESRVQSGGHSVAAGRLDAMDSVAGYVGEQLGGLAQLEYLKTLAKRIDTDWDGVVADLEKIRAAVVSRAGSVTNLTADAKTLDATAGAVQSFLDSLPAEGTGAATEAWSKDLVLPPVNELITVPTQVNYVGKGANLYKSGTSSTALRTSSTSSSAPPGSGTACACPAVPTEGSPTLTATAACSATCPTAIPTS